MAQVNLTDEPFEKIVINNKEENEYEQTKQNFTKNFFL